MGGRRGPGAGRPAKLYRRSSRQLDISLPPRRYELAARLLAAAIDAAPGTGTIEALTAVTHSCGQTLGAKARERAGTQVNDEALLQSVESVLVDYGFEPYRDPEEAVRLRNCPFHVLAEHHRSLICGMNLSLMTGLVESLGVSGIEAVLDPEPGRCCVTFQPTQLPEA